VNLGLLLGRQFLELRLNQANWRVCELVRGLALAMIGLLLDGLFADADQCIRDTLLVAGLPFRFPFSLNLKVISQQSLWRFL
jgi:hypothetical protein